MPVLLPRFMVILGWIFDKPLPLLFDPFESIVRYQGPLMLLQYSQYTHRFCIFLVGFTLYVSCGIAHCTLVHVMSYVVGDGKSNWLEGVILICLFPILTSR